MKRMNKTFETFEVFRDYSQPYGSLYTHLKYAESYDSQAKLLTKAIQFTGTTEKGEPERLLT